MFVLDFDGDSHPTSHGHTHSHAIHDDPDGPAKPQLPGSTLFEVGQAGGEEGGAGLSLAAAAPQAGFTLHSYKSNKAAPRPPAWRKLEVGTKETPVSSDDPSYSTFSVTAVQVHTHTHTLSLSLIPLNSVCLSQLTLL